MSGSRHRVPTGLKIIGTIKLLIAALLAATALGVFHLIGGGIGDTLEHMVISMHLDPKQHVINEALAKLSGLSDRQLRGIGAGTLVYALLHSIEGIGLWRGRHWAEYMVIIITGSLLPLEIYEIVEKLSPVRVGVLLVNLATLAYLVWRLRRDARASPSP